DVALCSSNRRLTKPLHNATVSQLQLVALVHAITLAHRLISVNCELTFRPPNPASYSSNARKLRQVATAPAARNLKVAYAWPRCPARRVRPRRGLYMPPLATLTRLVCSVPRYPPRRTLQTTLTNASSRARARASSSVPGRPAGVGARWPGLC